MEEEQTRAIKNIVGQVLRHSNMSGDRVVSEVFGYYLEHSYDKLIEPHVRDREIVEIGPGPTKLISTFYSMGAKGYIGVDPHNLDDALENVKEVLEIAGKKDFNEESWRTETGYELTVPRNGEQFRIELRGNEERKGNGDMWSGDGLLYLMSREDESATVVSSCVLQEDVLSGDSIREDYSGLYRIPTHEGVKYANLLSNEIYRVTPKGGITVHFAIDKLYVNALLDKGFEFCEEFDIESGMPIMIKQ